MTFNGYRWKRSFKGGGDWAAELWSNYEDTSGRGNEAGDSGTDKRNLEHFEMTTQQLLFGWGQCRSLRRKPVAKEGTASGAWNTSPTGRVMGGGTWAIAMATLFEVSSLPGVQYLCAANGSPLSMGVQLHWLSEPQVLHFASDLLSDRLDLHHSHHVRVCLVVYTHRHSVRSFGYFLLCIFRMLPVKMTFRVVGWVGFGGVGATWMFMKTCKWSYELFPS